MELQAKAQTDRGSILATLPGNGHEVDEVARPTLVSTVDPVERHAARERLEVAIKEHLPALRARAVQLCRSHFDAEDVIQEALLRALRTGSQLEDLTRARAWLLRIVTNTFLDHVRKQKRQPRQVDLLDDVPQPEPSEPSPWDSVGSQDLRAAIGELPDDTRETYRLYALENRDYADISRMQQIPTTTVGTRLYRARKQLRKLLLPASPPDKPHKGRR